MTLGSDFGQAKKGTKDTSDDTLSTKHQNSISALVPYSSVDSDVTAFTSSALDGSVVYWVSRIFYADTQHAETCGRPAHT